MVVWLLLVPLGVRVSEIAELRQLASSLGSKVSFQTVECDSASADAVGGASLERALKRFPGALGCLLFDFGLLPLLAALPSRMRRVLVLDGIPGWSPHGSAADVERALRLAVESARACPVDFCVPTSLVWAGLAPLLFPAARCLPALSAARSPKVDRRPGEREHMTLGMWVDGGERYAEGLSRFLKSLSALSAGAAELSDPPSEATPFASVELLLTPEFVRQAEVEVAETGPVLRSVEVSAGKRTTGAATLFFPLSDWPDLERVARLAGSEGSELLAWLEPLPGDLTAGRVLRGPSRSWPLKSGLLEALSPFASSDAEGVVVKANESEHADVRVLWETILAGADLPPAVPPAAGWMADSLWYEAWAEACTEPGERLRRLCLIRPHDAGALLGLAGEAIREDPALAWRLIGLSHAWVRAGAASPELPEGLLASTSTMFVSQRGVHLPEWGLLTAWLAGLKQRGRALWPLRKAEFARSPHWLGRGCEVEFSVGLKRLGAEQFGISGRGFLAVVAVPEHEVSRLRLERTQGRAAVLHFQLADMEPDWLVGLELRVNGIPVGAWLDLGESVAQVVVHLPDACEIAEHVYLQGLAEDDPEATLVLSNLALSTSGAEVEMAGVRSAHRLDLERLAQARGVFDSEYTGFGVSRWVDSEFALALPLTMQPELLMVNALVLRFVLPAQTRANGLPRRITMGGVSRALRPLRSQGEEVWFAAELPWPPLPELESLLVCQTGFRAQALAPRDPRVAAALLTGVWLAELSVDGERVVPPPGAVLSVDDPQNFKIGWHGLEHLRGRSARWMGPTASIFLPGGFATPRHLGLLLTGPCIPFNLTDVPLRARANDCDLAEVFYDSGAERWYRLFVSQVPIEAAGDVLEIALEAERSRTLGLADPRIASSLVDGAVFISAGTGTSALDFGASVLPLHALEHESWGAGLVGSWLPQEMVYLFASVAEPVQIRIEGAASTSRLAVEGLIAEIDGVVVEREVTFSQDGSWQILILIPLDVSRGAHFLRLRSPEIADGESRWQGRVMLREISLESMTEAGNLTHPPALDKVIQ